MYHLADDLVLGYIPSKLVVAAVRAVPQDEVTADIFGEADGIVDTNLDDSADLEDPDVIAEEIVDDLEAALGQFSVIVKQLRERDITG